MWFKKRPGASSDTNRQDPPRHKLRVRQTGDDAAKLPIDELLTAHRFREKRHES
jgi:hypothetical protein